MCLEIFGKLTKKIYCSLLSGALLFVVFAMSQSCYASVYREWTLSELKNILYKNCLNYDSTYNIEYVNLINSKDNELNNVVDSLNLYNYVFIGSYQNNLYIKCTDSQDTWYVYRNQPIINGSWGQVYRITVSNLSINIDESTSDLGSSWELNNYRYVGRNTWNNPQAQTRVWSGNTYNPETFFNEWYAFDDYFTYNYNVNLNDITIEDFNLMKQIPKDFNTYDYVAEFGKYSNLDITFYKPRYTIWKYQKPQNYFEPIISYDYNLYSYISDELGRLYLSGSMLIPNTIVEINLSPSDLDEFSSLSVLFYITDENSVIVTDSVSGNPTIDYTSTFNDDYYKRYSNIINSLISSAVGNIISPSGDVTGTIDFSPITQGITDINNTLTDGSQTTNIINSYISGDLPDVFGYQENFKTEYNLYWSPLNYLTTQIFNALTLNSTAEFHIPLRNGQTLVLSSDQFFVPEGPLKSFIRLYLVFATIYVVFLSFRRLINNLNSGGVNTILEQQGVDPDYIKM